MGRITTARTALWNAIEQGVYTTGKFRLKFKLQDDGSAMDEIEPAFGDLPAIAVMPESVTPKWYLNQNQKWPLFFRVVIWTAHWNMSKAEELLELTIASIFRAGADDSTNAQTSFIYLETGHHAEAGPITMTPTRVGKDKKTKAIRTQFNAILACDRDPRRYDPRT